MDYYLGLNNLFFLTTHLCNQLVQPYRLGNYSYTKTYRFKGIMLNKLTVDIHNELSEKLEKTLITAE